MIHYFIARAGSYNGHVLQRLWEGKGTEMEVKLKLPLLAEGQQLTWNFAGLILAGRLYNGRMEGRFSSGCPFLPVGFYFRS